MNQSMESESLPAPPCDLMVHSDNEEEEEKLESSPMENFGPSETKSCPSVYKTENGCQLQNGSNCIGSKFDSGVKTYSDSSRDCSKWNTGGKLNSDGFKSAEAEVENEEKQEDIFSWVIAVLAGTIYMFNGGVFYSNGLLLPEFIRMLGCSDVVGTWMSSVQMGLCQFLALLGGALIELYGCKAVNLAGTILISTGLVLSSFATSVPVFFLTYSIIIGIGLGLQFMPCIVVVQHHFSAKHRAAATGIASSGSPVGIFIFAVVTRWLLDTYACRGTLLLLGALNAHAIPLALIVWPRKSKPTYQPAPLDRKLEIIAEEEGDKEVADVKKTETHCGSHLNNVKTTCVKTLKEVARTLEHVIKGVQELRQLTVAVMFVSCVLFCLGYQTPFIFMPVNALLKGHSSWKAAYLVSIIGIADATGRLLFGCLGSVLPVSRTLLVAYGSLAAGVACCVSGVLNDYTALICASLIYGLGLATNVVLTAPVLVDLLGLERIARLFGLANVGYGFGFLCSPPFQAFLYEVTSNIALPFYFGGIMQILGTGCVFVVYFLHQKELRAAAIAEQLHTKKFEMVLLSNNSLASNDIGASVHSHLRSMTSLGDPDPKGSIDLKVIGSLHNLPVVNVFGSSMSIGSHMSTDRPRPWFASITSLDQRGPAKI